MEHITINKIGNNYWYIAPIFTMSRRKWHQRPYKSLRKLLTVEGHFDEELVIRFNGDKDLTFFRMACKLKNLPLVLKKQDLETMGSGGVVKLKISGLKPVLYFDLRSLRYLRRGFVPFFSKQFLNREFRDQKAIIYRKTGFVKYKAAARF